MHMRIKEINISNKFKLFMQTFSCIFPSSIPRFIQKILLLTICQALFLIWNMDPCTHGHYSLTWVTLKTKPKMCVRSHMHMCVNGWIGKSGCCRGVSDYSGEERLFEESWLLRIVAKWCERIGCILMLKHKLRNRSEDPEIANGIERNPKSKRNKLERSVRQGLERRTGATPVRS